MRRALAAAALLALAACGGDPKPTGPTWKGDTALAEDRGTSTEYVITPIATAAPEVLAGKALGAGTLVKQERMVRGAHVYRDKAGVTVRIRPETPIKVSGERPAVAGALPDEATVLKAARAVMTSFHLEPAQWTAEVKPGDGFLVVRHTMRAGLPVFEARGVAQPLASFAVDAGGVRSFTLTLATFAPREVAIMSQREAFGKLPLTKRYVAVRQVLVDNGGGAVRPSWEFKTEEGELHPVLAVLTP